MNTKNKKFLTRYTKQVLCDLGMMYLKLKTCHPLLLEQKIKDLLRKHPGVTCKIFGRFTDPSYLTVEEISDRIIYKLTRADEV